MPHPHAAIASALAIALTATLAAAQRITPPPLPPGSSKVTIEPGVKPSERIKPKPRGPARQHRNLNDDDSDRSRPDTPPWTPDDNGNPASRGRG